MSWQDSKSPDDLIDATEYTNMADTVEWVSGNFFSHSSNKDVHYPSSQLTNWLNNIYISTTASINKLNDVDTVSDTPARDEVLKWNGSNWVPATYNTTFEFSITSFSDGESTTQLIGTGVWKSATAISFTAGYENGPPDNANVYVGYNSTSYYKSGVIGAMDGSGYESGDNDVAVSYPHSKDQYLRFLLSSNVDSDTDTQAESSIYFRNYVYYGVLSKSESFSEADIEGLTSALTNSYTTTRSINAGAGEHLIIAYPESYTTIHANGFKFNSITCPFSSAASVSLTNSAGYTENYRVHPSKLPGLGNYSLNLSTSATLTNLIYYGVTETLDSYTESDIEGLGTSVASNTKGRTISPTVGATEYVLYCLPVRLGTVTFSVNGFTGGFQNPETISVTNVNGYTEDYYAYRSTNKDLGTPTIVVV